MESTKEGVTYFGEFVDSQEERVELDKERGGVGYESGLRI